MFSFNAATTLACYDMYPWKYFGDNVMLSIVCIYRTFRRY